MKACAQAWLKRTFLIGLFAHEDGDEEHPFGQSHRKDGLNENGCGCAGVTSNALSCLSSDEAYCEGGAEGGECDLNITFHSFVFS